MATLSQKVTEAKVTSDIARICLLIVIQAVQVGAHRLRFVKVDTCVTHNVIRIKVYNTKSLQILKLKEPE